MEEIRATVIIEKGTVTRVSSGLEGGATSAPDRGAGGAMLETMQHGVNECSFASNGVVENRPVLGVVQVI